MMDHECTCNQDNQHQPQLPKVDNIKTIEETDLDREKQFFESMLKSSVRSKHAPPSIVENIKHLDEDNELEKEREFFESMLKSSIPSKPAPSPTPKHILDQNRKRHLASLDELLEKTKETPPPTPPQSPKLESYALHMSLTYDPPENQLDYPTAYALYMEQYS